MWYTIISQPPSRMKMNSGIYCLFFNTNETFGMYYIGQSTDLNARLNKHLAQLRDNKHHNYKIQELYNLYGSPSIEVLEYIDNWDLLVPLEIKYIEKFDSYYNGLNLTLGGEGNSNGSANSFALYPKEVYIAIATQLAITGKTHREIAKELSVSDRVVGTISSGQAHNWLSKEIPELYNIILSKIGTRSRSETKDSVYIEVFNKLVHSTDTLIDIANSMNIGLRVVERIARGESHTWLQNMFPEDYLTLLNKKGQRKTAARGIREYKDLLAPDGTIHKVTNAREFARNNGLGQSSLSAVLRGAEKQHKGWKLA